MAWHGMAWHGTHVLTRMAALVLGSPGLLLNWHVVTACERAAPSAGHCHAGICYRCCGLRTPPHLTPLVLVLVLALSPPLLLLQQQPQSRWLLQAQWQQLLVLLTGRGACRRLPTGRCCRVGCVRLRWLGRCPVTPRRSSAAGGGK
jgi:hypothetical protein